MREFIRYYTITHNSSNNGKLQTRLNATQAALRAGYSEKTAYSAGEALLRNPEVKKEVEKRLEAQYNRAKMSKDEMLAGAMKDMEATEDGGLKLKNRRFISEMCDYFPKKEDHNVNVTLDVSSIVAEVQKNKLTAPQDIVPIDQPTQEGKNTPLIDKDL